MADLITSTQAVLQEDVISTTILDVLTASEVLPGAIMDMSGSVGPGQDRVSVPTYGNFAVTKKVPGVPVDAITNAFGQEELLLNEHAVIQFLIERRAELQSKVSLTDAYLRQGARDMAARVDLDIITAMNAGGTAKVLAVLGALSKADILDARKTLCGNNVSTSDLFALVHCDEESDLLGLTEFTQTNTAGTDAALRNGEIGRLFGFTFLVSSQQTAGTVSFWHRSGIAHAKQKAMTVDSDKDLPNLADRTSIDMLYGQKTMDGANRILVYS